MLSPTSIEATRGLERLLLTAWPALDATAWRTPPGPDEVATVGQLALAIGRVALEASAGQPLDTSACARQLADAAIPVLATSGREAERLRVAFGALQEREWAIIGSAFRELLGEAQLAPAVEAPAAPRRVRVTSDDARAVDRGEPIPARSVAPSPVAVDSTAKSILTHVSDRLVAWWDALRRQSRGEQEAARIDHLLRQFVETLAQTVHALRYRIGDPVSAQGRNFRQSSEIAGWRVQPSSRLDSERTVELTARAAGYFTPAYRDSRRRVDYVFLIKRLSSADHEAVRCRRLIELLRDGGTRLAVYYYDGDLASGYALDPATPTGRRPMSFHRLRDAHPTARLVLMSDGAEFIDAVDETVHENVRRALVLWPERVLATPRSYWEWPKRELVLAEVTGLSVVLSHPNGLAALPRVAPIAGSAMVPATNVLSAPDWLSTPPSWVYLNDPPVARLAEAAVDDLASYLGERGLRWVAACTLYPELRPELTEALGRKPIGPLVGTARGPVYSDELFARLCRLPWFRIGLLPRWVEVRLQERFADELDVLHVAYADFTLGAALDDAASDGALPVAATGMAMAADSGSGDVRLTRRSVALADLSPQASGRAQRALARIEPQLIAQIAGRVQSQQEVAARPPRLRPSRTPMSVTVLAPSAWRLLGGRGVYYCLSLAQELAVTGGAPALSTETVSSECLAQGRAILAAGQELSLADLAFGQLLVAEGMSMVAHPDTGQAFDAAIAGFRHAGREDLMPMALLARATYKRKSIKDIADKFDINPILADLHEAEDIAGSEMRAYLVDAALERARLVLDAPSSFDDAPANDAPRLINEAARLIADSGYRGRDGAMRELQERLRRGA